MSHVSNHQQLNDLLNSLLRLRTTAFSGKEENQQLPMTVSLWVESTMTGGFPSQRASKAGGVSMSGRQYDIPQFTSLLHSSPSRRNTSPRRCNTSQNRRNTSITYDSLTSSVNYWVWIQTNTRHLTDFLSGYCRLLNSPSLTSCRKH